MRHPGTVLVAHPSPDLYGSDRMLLASVGALLGAARRVVVTMPLDGPLTAHLRTLGAEVTILPVPVLRKAMLSPRGLVGVTTSTGSSLRRMLRLIQRCAPAAVYVNTLTIPSWLLAGRLAARPVLCHVHEAEEVASPLLGKGLHGPLLLAHRVLTNSVATAATLIDHVPRLASRIRVVYNGVAEPTVEPTPLAASPGPPLRLLLAGRLAPRKGTDVAIRAVRLLVDGGRDVRLTLAGSVFPGYEWYDVKLHELAQSLGVADRVEFAGFLPEVWPALARTDVALVPSRAEPFGNVAVEAALAGRPVVASDVQGLREIVLHRRTGLLVRSDDPAALADGVEELAGNWDAARAMAATALVEARRRFAPKRYDAEILAAVAAATGGARRGRTAST